MGRDLHQCRPFLNVPIQSIKPIVEPRSDELTVNLASLLISPDIKEEELLCISSYGESKKSLLLGPIDNKPEVLAYKVDHKADNFAPQPGFDAVRTKTHQTLSIVAADKEKGIDPEANRHVQIQISSIETNTRNTRSNSRRITHSFKNKVKSAILAQLNECLANTFRILKSAMGIFNYQKPFRKKNAETAHPLTDMLELRAIPRSFIKSNDPPNGNHTLPRTASHISNYFFPVLLALTL